MSDSKFVRYLNLAICVCAVFLSALTARAANVELSGWGSDFVSATNNAVALHRPLVLFWANTGCEHCEKLEEEVQSKAFVSWQDDSPYLFCFVLGKNGKDPDGTTIVRDFARTAAWTMSKPLKAYPFICLYWPKHDGSVVVKSFTTETASTVMTRADAVFADYAEIPDYLGGDLDFMADHPNARLEAEVGRTTYVNITVVRDVAAADYIATNTLKAVYGGVETLSSELVWTKGEMSRTMPVAIPSGAAVGEEMTVKLLDDARIERGAVRIHLVAEQENSTKNPFFVGEKTADDLGYGEWTMDLDVAMEKYKKNPDSHLMAIASGSLWCPDCVMTDGHVLETESFKAWAVDNKVILVDIDVPNFPNTTNSACLLTKVVGRTSDGYISGRGTMATNELERYQSGAGYLSRHMISDADAAKVLERNRSLVGKNTLNGGWNNPERANQNRTGIPNFFALDRTGALVGTFETFDAIGPFEFKEAYLNRFSELIALEDSDSAGDVSDRSWQTTKATYAGVGKASSATLSALDLIDTYKLAGTADVADMQTVTVKGNDANATVTVSIIEVVDGTAKTIAAATGRLSDGVSASGVVASSGGSYYVSVAGVGSGTLAADSDAASTVTGYVLSGTRVAIANPFSNDWTTKGVKATLPLYASDGKTLKGTLALELKKRGKISAKYSDGRKNLVTFSGAWDADIAADGTATAELVKKAYVLSLVMGADGVVSAVVGNGTEAVASGECGLAVEYGDFSGVYTVAFPAADASVTTEPAGAAVMTLKMAATASAKKQGKFSYTLYLPDGKKISGTSGVTWFDANFGIVPVLKTSGVETFATVLKIRRNAGTAPSTRAIVAQDGTVAVWTNATKGRSFSRTFGVYGSWYDKKDSLLVGISDELLALEFLADASTVAPSQAWGALVSVVGDGAGVLVTDKKLTPERIAGFTFKLNRSTGVFTGASRLAFEDKGKVAAKFTGVLTRGWFSDCDCGEDDDDLIEMENLAFGLGHCVFADRVSKKSVKRSFSIGIK